MKKTLQIVGNVILWLFVVLAALMTILAFSAQKNQAGVPSIFGKMPVSILSDSMNPTFSSGNMIICDELSSKEKAELQVGDVITFSVDLNDDGNMEFNTHRIISTRSNGGYTYYTTQGDNNSAADNYEVRYDMVVGKWTGTRLPVIGSVLNYLQTSTGFLICIVIPLILFFLFEVYRFVAAVVAIKSKKMSAEEAEELKRKAVEEYLAAQATGAEADAPATDSVDTAGKEAVADTQAENK